MDDSQPIRFGELKPIKFELFWDEPFRTLISLEERKSPNGNRWAITKRGECLGKTPTESGYYLFEYEPLPSSRGSEYYKEYRWDTAEDAYDFWTKNRSKILATREEVAAFIETHGL